MIHNKEKERMFVLLQYPEYTPDSKSYAKKNKQQQYSSLKKWRDSNPLKVRAHRMVFVAVRNGSLKKQSCAICGVLKTQAHHDNYNLPLNVRWLCKLHHTEADKIVRETEKSRLLKSI